MLENFFSLKCCKFSYIIGFWKTTGLETLLPGRVSTELENAFLCYGFCNSLSFILYMKVMRGRFYHKYGFWTYKEICTFQSERFIIRDSEILLEIWFLDIYRDLYFSVREIYNQRSLTVLHFIVLTYSFE